jgi:hypothetical protein
MTHRLARIVTPLTPLVLAMTASLVACSDSADDEDAASSEQAASSPTIPSSKLGVVIGAGDLVKDGWVRSHLTGSLAEIRGPLGAGWIRFEALWADRLDPASSREIIRAAHARGLRVLVVVATPGAKDIDPDRYFGSTYEKRLRRLLDEAFIDAYSTPEAIEAGNEIGMDAWAGDFAAVVARRTKDLLLGEKAARHRGIRVVSAGSVSTPASPHPGMRSYFSAFFGSRAFCADVSAANPDRCRRVVPFDGVGVHPYETYVTSSLDPDVRRCINERRSGCFTAWTETARAGLVAMQALATSATGGSKMPLWATEIGWQSPPGGKPFDAECPDDTATDQMHNCVRTGAQMEEAIRATASALRDERGTMLVEMAAWYDFMDDTKPGENGKHFGLRWRGDAGAKAEAWNAFANLTRTTETAKTPAPAAPAASSSSSSSSSASAPSSSSSSSGDSECHGSTCAM